ncbi:MAG: rhomboid family intramembrane serine protease [Promethearchaeota archaeon]
MAYYNEVIRSPTHYMTYILILLNAVIFIFQQFNDTITDLFAMVPALILSGQNLFTLITSMFLHGDFLHLLINMYFLYIFGSVVEHEMHPFIYLSVYILAGVVGSFGHILISYTLYSVVNPWSPSIPTIGASGAIFGIMAAYAYLLPRRPVGVYGYGGRSVAIWNMIFLYFAIEVFQLFFSFGSNIAHGAHVFGFIGGYVIALVYRSLRVQSNQKKAGAEYDPYEHYV